MQDVKIYNILNFIIIVGLSINSFAEDIGMSCKAYREYIGDYSIKCPGDPPETGLISKCSCQKGGLLLCKYELCGFNKGEFQYPDSDTLNRFLNIIKTDIDLFSPEKIFGFHLTGQADGLKNEGVCCKTDVPSSCATGLSNGSTLNDPDLAKVRGCIIREKIESHVKQLMSWRGDIEIDYRDIPTGGNSGEIYRKVVFKFSVTGVCDEK